jgi:alpha-ketoglutarate-dependent taurine dioxygenase
MVNGLSSDVAVLDELTGELSGTEETRLVVYQPTGGGVDVVAWAARRREELTGVLDEYGAVLVRGVVDTPELIEGVATAVGGELLEYTERSTPRSAVQGNVYTSTEYPADQTIPQHNEMSYAHSAPRVLYFACARAAESGGATPLANSAAVLDRLPRDMVDRFRERGVRYTRSYTPGMGLTWQEAFQMERREDVEEYCRRCGMEYEWVEDGLRTRHRRPAVATDPVSGREVWFNQAHLFHVLSLPKKTSEALLGMFDEPDLPRHAFYGDGSPIPGEELDLITKAYADVQFEFSWLRGDLLMVNNLLVSHGRRPYSGPRSVLVAMTGSLDVGAKLC